MEREYHVFTSVSPVSLAGGSVDFSGQLQVTVDKVVTSGAGARLPRQVSVVVFASWDFGLPLDTLSVHSKIEQHTYNADGVVSISTLYSAELPMRAMPTSEVNEHDLPSVSTTTNGNTSHMTIDFPPDALASVEKTQHKTFCVHIGARVTSLPGWAMHRYPQVTFYM